MAEHEAARPRVLVVTGPTASGKTAVAIEAAKRVDGEIICADSMQIYAVLRIGTARPDGDELAAVPHHLFGFADPAAPYSVFDYCADAAREIEAVAARGKTPVLCGGTGLYISSLLADARFESERTDPALRDALYEEYARRGGRALIDEIAQTDPESAAALHPNNAKRIVRALELIRSTGRGITAQNERSRIGARPYPHSLFLLDSADRDYLYRRIERRVDRMVEAGLVEEARLVYENRARYATAAQAIGYKEFFDYFEGRDSLVGCVEALKRATRRYAKRQRTWWRRETEAVGLEIEGSTAPALGERIAQAWRRQSTAFPA